MKKRLIILLYVLFTQPFFAQQLEQLATETAPGWYTFKSNINLSTDQFLNMAVEVFNLGSNHQFTITKVQTDELGFTHTRLQQYYKGVQIEGADLILHERNSRLKSINGKLKRNINLVVSPTLDSKTAITKALDYIGADAYMWESEKNNNFLKEVLKDSSASYYPNPVLQIVNPKSDIDQYKLVYKVNIYASKPLLKQDVYIDANLGKVLYSINGFHLADTTGVAFTKYYGQKNITTDYVQATGLFRLRESTGGGIHTYDGRNGLLPTKDFTDSDNVWNNINVHQDEIATDVHWGAEQAYAYYLEKHNRSSFDNQNGRVTSFVHASSGDGAKWDGQSMHFGDGYILGPATSIDLIGHEFTHGVVQHTAGLSYTFSESAALNESFCDIFGNMIEYYTDSANGDYLFAEDTDTNGLGYGSLIDPNSRYSPDTYLGKYMSGNQHKDAGIQSYGFYLLAEGDSGINDLGHYYNITGIGKEKASKIMYRNLAYYLTSMSTFYDSRNGALSAARDIYGDCSDEVSKVSEAWHAVGVGRPFGTQDIGLMTISLPSISCRLDSAEQITGDMLLNDCSNNLAFGDSVTIGYQIDNNPPVIETFPVNAGPPIAHTTFYKFQTRADFSVTGTYHLKVWVDYAYDQYPANDTIHKLIKSTFLSDFSAQKLVNPVSSCNITGQQQVEIDFQLENCSVKFDQEYLVLGYRLDGNPPVLDTIVLDQTWQAVNEYSHKFNELEDFSSKGEYELTYWISYQNDPNPSNDTVHEIRIQNSEVIESHFFNFENPITTVDSIYFLTDPDNRIHISTKASHSGNNSLYFTGGNALNYRHYALEWLKIVDNIWDYNPEYSSQACACVNARFWDSVKVEFDLKQTYSTIWDSINNESGSYTSAFRVTANGKQVSKTFHPSTINSDPFNHYYLNLKSYAHSEFLLCLESRNLVSEKYDVKDKGDNAYIDNLWIHNDGNIGLTELEKDISTWSIYPNPSQGEFVLALESKQERINIYQIFNATGRLLKQQQIELEEGINEFMIDLSNYPKGVYLIHIQGSTKQIVINK